MFLIHFQLFQSNHGIRFILSWQLRSAHSCPWHRSPHLFGRSSAAGSILFQIFQLLFFKVKIIIISSGIAFDIVLVWNTNTPVFFSAYGLRLIFHSLVHLGPRLCSILVDPDLDDILKDLWKHLSFVINCSSVFMCANSFHGNMDIISRLPLNVILLDYGFHVRFLSILFPLVFYLYFSCILLFYFRLTMILLLFVINWIKMGKYSSAFHSD